MGQRNDPEMVILHADDSRNWLGIVLKRRDALAAALGRPVTILSANSVEQAMSLIGDKEPNIDMERPANQGCRLDAAILDLLMGGGRENEVRTWLKGVRELATATSGGRFPPPALAAIDQACPAVPLGRKAAARGAKVVVLTNVDKFLPEAELSLEQQQKLLMAAIHASAYVIKDDHWLDGVTAALK